MIDKIWMKIFFGLLLMYAITILNLYMILFSGIMIWLLEDRSDKRNNYERSMLHEQRKKKFGGGFSNKMDRYDRPNGNDW